MKYTLMTYNIRIDVKSDGKHRFKRRLSLILKTLKKLDVDIICFQEITRKMFKKIYPHLKDYNYVGKYRDSTIFGEANFILYKKNLFTLVDTQTLWLSDTPLKPNTRYHSDQSILPRIITKAKLKTNDNKILNVFNTHFDYLGVQSRISSSKQISSYINEVKGKEPLILVGDFNASPNEETIQIINSQLIDITNDIDYTFHNFYKNDVRTKIDYIFVNNLVKYDNVNVIMSDVDDSYLSDHHPIYTEFEIL